jgi:biopolymer transport protein ExbD
MPATKENERGRGTVSGLRTRFSPKNRVGQGVVGMAPWLDIMLLFLLFALLQNQIVLQPGAIVHLPRAAFADGSRPAMSLVALSVAGDDGNRHEIVFFDDARYPVAEPRFRQALREAVARQARLHSQGDLAILADREMSHGTLVLLYDMAREAGIARVNVAARESAAE